MFAGSDLVTEINEAFAPFKSQVVNMTHVQCALALARQKRIAAFNDRIQHAHVDGLGEVVSRIDTDLFHRLAAIHGYDALKDPDFLRSLLRDNPECRVKSVSRHVRVTVGDTSYRSHGSHALNTDAATAASRADVCTAPC
jgi:hypothetical protein